MRTTYISKRNLFWVIAIGMLLPLLWSCKKNDAAHVTDVYLAGSVGLQGSRRATYWKNGTAVSLTAET